MKTATVVISSSLSRTESIVALREGATTGPAVKSACHRPSFKRSRSGMTQMIECYMVSSSIQKTVQLFFKLELTGLLGFLRPKQCILRMESELSATNRQPPVSATVTSS